MTVHDIRDPDVPDEHHVARQGEWLCQSRDTQQKWVTSVIDHVEANPSSSIDPTLKAFQEAVDKDTRLSMLFQSCFDQVPHKKPYNKDPEGGKQVRSLDQLVRVLDHVIHHAPSWTDVGQKHGLVGVPINAILDWPMGTRSGFALFLDPTVNAHLKEILNAWGKYLQSPESAEVLGTDKNGWFGESGLKHLTEVANLGKTDYTFEELFHCDPKAEHHGYKSWDDFFTRLFKEEMRPVAGKGDDSIIANPCESRTYKVAENVQARAKYWVKGQPYSVLDLLHHDPDAGLFVGGTIYQAFLSALSYHRWHSPVSGTIKKAYVVDGTYYSEPLFEDFTSNGGADPDSECTSQEYLSAVATRGIILIEADNPKLGLVAFVPIGMTEVSTCDIQVKEGQHVEKGDELGMFRFGGSSSCTLFEKGVKLEGFPQPGHPWNVPVRSELARVV